MNYDEMHKTLPQPPEGYLWRVKPDRDECKNWVVLDLIDRRGTLYHRTLVNIAQYGQGEVAQVAREILYNLQAHGLLIR
jgi:hypothetical protein